MQGGIGRVRVRLSLGAQTAAVEGASACWLLLLRPLPGAIRSNHGTFFSVDDLRLPVNRGEGVNRSLHSIAPALQRQGLPQRRLHQRHVLSVHLPVAKAVRSGRR